MFRIAPIGLNLKPNDRDVKDGFLQESINLQWRNDSFKPIPERVLYDINVDGYSEIIFHKVGDENQINVLGFKDGSNSNPLFLAFDLADDLAGGDLAGWSMEWIGTIIDGEYQSRAASEIPIYFTPGMSFTILNGMLYFMGDGSTAYERYYYRLQYNEATASYETKDMYAWKSLIPFYPQVDEDAGLVMPKSTNNALIKCGIILIRFTLSLKTGEEVLHTPIYPSYMYGVVRSDSAIEKGNVITNIHTLVSTLLEFEDSDLLKEEVTSINMYASIPSYVSELSQTWTIDTFYEQFNNKDVADIQRLIQTPFYLCKTLEVDPSNTTEVKYINLSVGQFGTDISYKDSTGAVNGSAVVNVDINTLAAGQILPEDNFSHHRLYGEITSYNGRLIVSKPVTVLSPGYARAFAWTSSGDHEDGYQSYEIETEDGSIAGPFTSTHKGDYSAATKFSRGLISYPDYRASRVLTVNSTEHPLKVFQVRKNVTHNIAVFYDIAVDNSLFSFTEVGNNIETTTRYSVRVRSFAKIFEEITAEGRDDNYSSENRIQFSEAGEFSVWPVINSERIGEGRIMAVGSNSVNPSNAEIIAPLIIGTSDGVYTINFDPSGVKFIASITKTANLPYISSETLQIEGFLLFVSDKGLMAIQNGDIINLTIDHFPDQGDGNFPVSESVYAGYNALTNDFFGGANPYLLDDIINYMKGAVLAYDGRRDNIWCSNANYDFSLIYNMPSKTWTMSTLVFRKKVEFFSVVDTVDGEVFSRYMVVDKTNTKLFALSAEDSTKEVDVHLLTRPFKFDFADDYKILSRMFSRCLIIRADEGSEAYFALGLWGKNDVNKFKTSVPIAALKDDRDLIFTSNVRHDIPVSCRKGKYKSITASFTGKMLPDSDITAFDFDIQKRDNKKMR